MDNRRDPPFFSEDNVGPFCYRLPFYDTMELFIETLTGTCFELRVSPFEAIISVKAKIQRLEGIPICQQHLIWNNMELEDDYCLNYYNISEGCTLKLVLAMRGGPINTSRVPVEDPLKEMAEYMESSRDEVWEKASCNKQVTLLVYQEGDQLNFFRVVDRGDGTLTPLSESFSSGSVYSLYADEDEEIEPSPSGQQIIENSITMNKMKLLKAKMENMDLSKKPKKAVRVKPRPPAAPRPPGGRTAAARRGLLSVLPHIAQARRPSPGDAGLPDLAGGAAARPAALPAAGGLLTAEGARESCAPGLSSSGRGPPARVPHAEAEARPELAGAAPRLGAALPRRAQRCAGKLPLPAAEAGVPAERLPPGARAAEGGAGERGRGAGGSRRAGAEASLADGGSGAAAEQQRPGPAAAAPRAEPEPAAPRSGRLSPPRPAGRPAAPASPSARRAPEARARAGSAVARTARLRAVQVGSPGRRCDPTSKAEARGASGVASRAPKEPAGSVRSAGFLASLARSARGAGGLPAALQPFREESPRKSPQLGAAERFLSARGIGMNGNNTTSGKRVGECTHHLPPVKAPVQTKKTTTKHCFLCGKKTGLATSYECRCGNNFCASHRYAETHSCTYDYKSAGRRHLQEAHPVVNAPKLPKL